jgi:hypothetical protein
MRGTNLLHMALGLASPSTETGSGFHVKASRINIQIDFPAGSRFACLVPQPGQRTIVKQAE